MITRQLQWLVSDSRFRRVVVSSQRGLDCCHTLSSAAQARRRYEFGPVFLAWLAYLTTVATDLSSVPEIPVMPTTHHGRPGFRFSIVFCGCSSIHDYRSASSARERHSSRIRYEARSQPPRLSRLYERPPKVDFFVVFSRVSFFFFFRYITLRSSGYRLVRTNLVPSMAMAVTKNK